MQAQYIDPPAYGPQPASALDAETSPLPYTPLPQRRGPARTALLVAAALLIPATVIGVRALIAGQPGGSGSEQVATEPEPAELTPAEPNEDRPTDDRPKADEPKPTEPDSRESRTAPSGPTVQRAGYQYAVPEGWGIRPDMARRFALDSGDSVVAVSQPDRGFETNVLVAASPANGFTIEEAKRAWTPKDGRVTPMSSITLDGVKAVGLRNETVSPAGRPIVQLGYLAVRGDRIYSIVLSVPVRSEAAARPAFEAVLRSWRWVDDAPSPARTT